MAINKVDFLRYFKYPKCFWFLLSEQLDSFFLDELEAERLSEIKWQDLINLLRELDTPANLFYKNSKALSSIKDLQLKEAYKKFFSLKDRYFYDFSKRNEDVIKEIKAILALNHDAFIYKPLLIYKDLEIRPSAIYKYKNNIYLIDNTWSSTLKKEFLSYFVFYNYFLTSIGIVVRQYLISYLSKEITNDTELKIGISNSLPYSSKVRVPDKKMRNINSLFGLDIEYEESLYELFLSKEEYEEIDNEDWGWEVDIAGILKDLEDFSKNPNREVELSDIYIGDENPIVSRDIAINKYIFKNIYPSFTFSSKLVSFKKVLEKIEGYEDKNEVLEFIGNMSWLGMPKDQRYMVFEEAVSYFKLIEDAIVKVYYDFESISLPIKIVEKTKSYMQLVLQLSLIEVKDNKEQRVVNLIIDPKELKISDFKRIIDSIYRDEIGVIYIVYNKAFENTRLKEMAEIIGEEEYFYRVTFIIDRTIDLAEWFRFGKNPRILLQDLKGFYSIKQVIKHIPDHIFKKTKAIKYDDLDYCRNGIMASQLFIARYLSTINEEEIWKKDKEFLIKYCENDVRSMIAVELFIKYLIDNNKYPFFNLEIFQKRVKSF